MQKVGGERESERAVSFSLSQRETERKGTLRKLVRAQRDHTHNGVPMHLWIWV